MEAKFISTSFTELTETFTLFDLGKLILKSSYTPTPAPTNPIKIFTVQIENESFV